MFQELVVYKIYMLHIYTSQNYAWRDCTKRLFYSQQRAIRPLVAGIS